MSRWRPGSKSSGIKVGILNRQPALITNFGGRKYGVALTLDGAGNTVGDEFIKNLRVKGDAVFDSGASVLRIKSDSITINESNTEVASFGATTTIGNTGTEHVKITGSSMEFKDAGTVMASMSGGSITLSGAVIISASNDDAAGGDIKNIIMGEGNADPAGSGLGGNVIIGINAGANIEADCFYNVGIGAYALNLCADGDGNTAIGYNALRQSNFNNSKNTCVGAEAGYDLTDGTHNTCMGHGADVSASGATNQTVIGYDAQGVGNNSVTLGDGDVDDVYMADNGGAVVHCDGIGIGLGTAAPVTKLDVHSSGTELAAAFGMADDGNVWVATRTAEPQNNYGAYAFMVGSAAIDGVSSGNCTSYITSTVKNSGGTLQGDITFATNSGDSLTPHLNIGVDGTMTGTDTDGTSSMSDSRIKENIKDFTGGLDIVNKLTPVTFDFKPNYIAPKTKDVRGFIAQDVEKIDSYFIGKHTMDSDHKSYDYVKDTGGEHYTSKLNGTHALLISAIQELSAKIDNMDERLTNLEVA